MIDYLRRRLSLEDKPVRLKQMLRNIDSRAALVCMFLAMLELVRLQAIQLRQERLFGEILIRKHVGFDAIMNEQAAGAGRLEMKPNVAHDGLLVARTLPVRLAAGNWQRITYES